jgi:hypothetical protein
LKDAKVRAELDFSLLGLFIVTSAQDPTRLLVKILILSPKLDYLRFALNATQQLGQPLGRLGRVRSAIRAIHHEQRSVRI